MWRMNLALLVTLTATLSGNPNHGWQTQRDVTPANSFPGDPNVAGQPQLPDDLKGVILEYSSWGGFGGHPNFTLHLEKNKAVWEGGWMVRKSGKAERRISDQLFGQLVRAWLNAKMYTMRDDYCGLVLDAEKTSIELKAPSYSKTVTECWSTRDAESLSPPEQYFQLSHQLEELARSNHWL